MYAYVINHFGNNPRYLEYEIYFLINLRNLTNYDIIYMYSGYDTPNMYIDIIKSLNLNIKFYKYNDDGITINLSKSFISKYDHFNTLRTCNFIFSYLITGYKKLCILESDMYLIDNIDNIFELNCPSVFYTMNKDRRDLNIINYKFDLDLNDILINCEKGSPINGGLLLITPSKDKFKLYKKNIKRIINNNCAFPNETLFLISNKICYNLPIKYNFLHYNLRYFNEYKDVKLIHYNNTIYKPLDIIKDNYIDKLQYNNRNIINKYKKSIYSNNYKKVNSLLKKLIFNPNIVKKNNINVKD